MWVDVGVCGWVGVDVGGCGCGWVWVGVGGREWVESGCECGRRWKLCKKMKVV